MKNDFLEKLQNDILVMYLPMGSELMHWGKDMESHLSEWILANPEKYQDALRKSYEAGCDMGHTGTQASSIFRATPFGVQDRIKEFNYKSAKLARAVTPSNCYVVGNISVSNPDFMEPVGKLTYDEVYNGYKEQIVALAEGGVDVFHIGGSHNDTMEVAIKVAKDFTSIPIIASSIFYKGKQRKGFRTLQGKEPKDIAKQIDKAGADVVGFNCGLISYADCVEIIEGFREGTNKYIHSQPDAGHPDLIDGVTVHPATPEELGLWVPKWVKAGARLVGGCCGTSIEHYRAAATAVKKLRSSGLA
jgi:5-methyltetrahydrofolate--homocysteine methyltransferase